MDKVKMVLNNKKVLVTGGAGFIGSNIVEALLSMGVSVRVFDNLSTGKRENIVEFFDHPKFEFLEGDITVKTDCEKAVEGIDLITHQAALGSVPRSIEFPGMTHEVNATGFLNMLHASKEAGVKRFVFASSSSVYGDSTVSPKNIGNEGNLLSPYAVTKALNEEYSKVYFLLHEMQTIGLRYFNVFGPKQDPNGVYAAAIPKFVESMLTGGEIIIHGDGEQTRDFTYVRNAVMANLLALTVLDDTAFGQTFNVACGRKFSLNEVISSIKETLISKKKYNENCTISHGDPRKGDIRNSLADISNTQDILNYSEIYQFEEGIEEYLSQF